MNVFTIVRSSDRLPQIGEHVIVGWDKHPHSSVVAHLDENNYWFLSNEAADCDTPDFWLEDFKLPRESAMKKEMHKEPADQNYDRGFKDCYNWLLNLLIRR